MMFLFPIQFIIAIVSDEYHDRAESYLNPATPGEIMDAEKLSGRPVRLVRSRVAAKAVKMLFKELVRELVCQNCSEDSIT